MDYIEIKGLEVMACHGVLARESFQEQPFVADICLGVDLKKAGETDDLKDTVNYAAVAKLVADRMVEGNEQLLECMAARIADAILAAYKPVQEVTLCLKKPQAPMEAVFDYVAVKICRTREVTL